MSHDFKTKKDHCIWFRKIKIDQIDITKIPTIKKLKIYRCQFGNESNIFPWFGPTLQLTPHGLCISRRCSASKDGRSHSTRPGHESETRPGWLGGRSPTQKVHLSFVLPPKEGLTSNQNKGHQLFFKYVYIYLPPFRLPSRLPSRLPMQVDMH